MVTIDGGGGEAVITPIYGNRCVCVVDILEVGENPPPGTPAGLVYLQKTE